MPKLKKLVQQKLLENEFENKPKVRDGVQAPYQHLLDEIRYLDKKMKSCHFQVDRLEDRLRDLQKNYYDDMVIVDENHKMMTTPPWKSSNEYTRNKYVFWDFYIGNMVRQKVCIEEIAIRKEGNEKQIKVLDTTCSRIKALDKLFNKLHTQKNKIKQELNRQYGSAVASDLSVDASDFLL